MNLTALSAGFNFEAQRLALRWAKENLPDEKYQEIHKSYNALLKRTTVFIVVCCLPIIIAFLFLVFHAPFSKRAETEAIPKNATNYVLARVDYDGNFYWTHDSIKYEYPLKEYGLSPEEYKFGDKVKVYVDDAQNVIELTTIEDGFTIREIEVLAGSIGAILVPVLLILCIYIPIAYRTFGKPWRDFYREFCREFDGR